MAASQGRLAARVGAGILLTRVLGFVRERVFAHYFGDGVAADAFRAALRIPNVIRNLLGEGTLSASFIPVYAGMIERGETEDARRLSSVIASVLVLLTALLALVGILLAPVITAFVAPGFSGARRDLTVTLVQIMFPMSGVMILSAWCLGILNTHRRFFLSYAAPALWNIAQITTLVALGGLLVELRLVVALAWGALAGSLLQLLVQLPATLRLAGGVGWRLDLGAPGVRTVVRRWVPVIVGAGAYQISSIIDTQLASLLPPGAVAILGYAQLVAILPVSLFGISVAAVALPELSRDVAADDRGVLRNRVGAGTRRIAYFVLPAAVGLGALSPQIIGALFQTGAFGAAQTAIAAGVLSAYAIGIPAQASLKLFASGHYARGDTKTPVRFGILSVAVSAVSAYLLMRRFGPAGIALGAAIAAWVNASLNFGALSRRVGRILDATERRAVTLSVISTVPAALAGVAVTRALAVQPLWLSAVAAVLAFAGVYGVLTLVLRHPEARRVWSSIRRR
ncbi:MAG: murein biosynthesis integral membrane protein MurJ [Gemmatimonadota bacterium]|nr:MAG: murein biosynthesis integral membrane protein MurJ [Gemmatimonadota bacterium]